MGELMRRFVEEADRGQWTLLPECLDDFIDESNPVRMIDVFVDALDLAEMSFEGVSRRRLVGHRNLDRGQGNERKIQVGWSACVELCVPRMWLVRRNARLELSIPGMQLLRR
jgi:hypothetical protein